MSYVQGFVLAVPDANKSRYLEQANVAARFFRENGALRVVEAWGDDVPEGHTTDFRRAVKAEPGETVVFSWIEWPSKEVRDSAIAKMWNAPDFQHMDMACDGKRMILGGFATVLDERA